MLLAACGGAALLIAPSPWYPDSLVFLTLFCAQQQDVPVGFGVAAVLLVIGLRPVLAPRTADRQADILATTAAIHAIFERWIRDTPGQWMWAHRRWG